LSNLKKSGSFTTITLIIIGCIAALTFFQENIMVSLVSPLRDIFETIFSFFPAVLFIMGCVYLVAGLINKRGRAGKIILGIICLLFGLYLGSPFGIENLFSWVIFGRDTPKGWH